MFGSANSAADRFDKIGVAAAIVIAAASMVQAAVGGAVLQRVIGYSKRLDGVRELTGFLLLSPMLCPCVDWPAGTWRHRSPRSGDELDFPMDRRHAWRSAGVAVDANDAQGAACAVS